VQCLKDKPNALMNASGLANKSLMYLNGLQPVEVKNPQIKLDINKPAFIKKVDNRKVA
jgi:hypothetical protein